VQQSLGPGDRRSDQTEGPAGGVQGSL
jgi:hypothetical protein